MTTYYTSLSRDSTRVLALYSLDDDRVRHLTTLSFDMSPSILVPRYDPDVSVVYLVGKVRYCLPSPVMMMLHREITKC